MYPVIKCGSQYCFQYSVLPHPMKDGTLIEQAVSSEILYQGVHGCILNEIEKDGGGLFKAQFELASVTGYVRHVNTWLRCPAAAGRNRIYLWKN